MTDVLPGKGDFRDRMRAVMRASILKAARNRAAVTGWASVRMADIAEDVGVSRQTVYNEFGAKDDLAQALFEVEVEELIAGIKHRADRAPSFPVALTEVLEAAFEVAANHDIVQRMLDDARSGATVNVLSILTWGARTIGPARRFFLETFTDRWPVDDMDLADQVVDQLVRLTICEVLAPSGRPREQVIEHLVATAVALLHPVHRQVEGSGVRPRTPA